MEDSYQVLTWWVRKDARWLPCLGALPKSSTLMSLPYVDLRRAENEIVC
jgi:hypothetical protein